jgi:hypothetical protein
MQARPIEQNATLLGAEPQVEPGSDSAFKGLGFYGNVAMAMSTANGIEQFTRCGWGAGAMYGIFGPLSQTAEKLAFRIRASL